MNLTLHPIADLFPRMPNDEFEALKEDIRIHGVRQPILIHDGQILDGRHRWEAAQKLRIECPTIEWDGRGSLIDTVVSMNLKRRHLTASQQAAAAVEAIPLYEAEAKERQREHGGTAPGRKNTSRNIALSDSGKSATHAARVFGVSPRYVEDAKTIREAAPERFEAVKRGHETISQVKRELHRSKLINRLAEKSAAPCENERPVPLILADPPWRYEFPPTASRAVENHYPSMSLDEIKNYPVGDLATRDAILFLWATSPKLGEAQEVITAWGFNYRTCLVWVKDKIGMGHWARQQHELILVATRGKVPAPKPALRPASVIEAPRGRHSEKPEIVYEILERMYPEWEDNRRELFARKRRAGWLAIGNEI